MSWMEYKGVGIVFVREQVRNLTAEQRDAFLDALRPEERECFESSLASEWVSVKHAAACFETLARVAYADEPSPVRAVGRALADHNLSGVYRFLVRVATVNFLVSQTARLWSTYHRVGDAKVTTLGDRHIVLSVESYPGLPAVFRDCMAGWLERAMERCGAQNVRVTHDIPAPPPWRWVARWSDG